MLMEVMALIASFFTLRHLLTEVFNKFFLAPKLRSALRQACRALISFTNNSNAKHSRIYLI